MANEEKAYMGTKEASQRWDVLPETVSKWCREGKIPGVEQDGKGSPWRIPYDAQRPNTKKAGKKK